METEQDSQETETTQLRCPKCKWVGERTHEADDNGAYRKAIANLGEEHHQKHPKCYGELKVDS